MWNNKLAVSDTYIFLYYYDNKHAHKHTYKDKPLKICFFYSGDLKMLKFFKAFIIKKFNKGRKHRKEKVKI